jgi:vitamin B12 transporter
MLNNNKSYAVYASTISLLMSLTAVSASAEEARNPFDAETNQIDEIIVSATGMPTPASQIGVSMDVITAEDIARQQIRLLPNILSKLPSANFSQEGGMGGLGYLRIRGLDRQYTAIYVDGVSLNDPSDINSSAELANFLTTDIERIELVRGS